MLTFPSTFEKNNFRYCLENVKMFTYNYKGTLFKVQQSSILPLNQYFFHFENLQICLCKYFIPMISFIKQKQKQGNSITSKKPESIKHWFTYVSCSSLRLKIHIYITMIISSKTSVATTKPYLNVDKRLTLCNVQRYVPPSTPPPRSTPTSTFASLASHKLLIWLTKKPSNVLQCSQKDRVVKGCVMKEGKLWEKNVDFRIKPLRRSAAEDQEPSGPKPWRYQCLYKRIYVRYRFVRGCDDFSTGRLRELTLPW